MGYTNNIKKIKAGKQGFPAPTGSKASPAKINKVNFTLEWCAERNGNIEKVFENGVLKCRYTYDELDRLIREDNR